MPTNFTVVPVKYNTRKAKEGDKEDDLDDNNVLKEEEESAAGERVQKFYDQIFIFARLYFNLSSCIFPLRHPRTTTLKNIYIYIFCCFSMPSGFYVLSEQIPDQNEGSERHDVCISYLTLLITNDMPPPKLLHL